MPFTKGAAATKPLGTRKSGKRVGALLVLSAMGTVALPAQTPATPRFIQTNLDGGQTLVGHVPLEVRNHTAVLKYHASLNIEGRIILPLGNQPELTELLEDLYNPNSPRFHQFLTPDQFAQRFSPSTIDSMQVRRFLESAGISVTGQSGNGTVLRVTGPSESYEQAFGLRINYYQGNDGAVFFCAGCRPDNPCRFGGQNPGGWRLGQSTRG